MWEKFKQAIQWLGIMRALLGLLQPIKDLVEAVEQADEGEGNGARKKEAVMALLSEAIDTAKQFAPFDVPKEKILDFVSRAIDVVVNLFNLMGHFRHGTTASNQGN